MTISEEKLLRNFPKPRYFKHNCYVHQGSNLSRPFFYVKVHKAASTTIISSLASRLNQSDGGEFHEEESQRAHTADIKGRVFWDVSNEPIDGILESFRQESAFRFTMLRDPVKRVVSAWADKVDRKGRSAKRLKTLLGMRRPQKISLSQFVGLLENNSAVLNLDHHWRPQVKEVALDTLRYDFIGDTGQLQHCLNHVFARVFGDAEAKIVDTRESIGHFTNSDELLASLSGTDRRILERIYQDDRDAYEAAKANIAKDLPAA